MRGRLLFAAGLAAGYVVGARAGRPAYDAITHRIRGVAESPTAREAVLKAKDVLEEGAPRIAAVGEAVASTAAGAASAASNVGVDDGERDASKPDGVERAEPLDAGDAGTSSGSTTRVSASEGEQDPADGGAPTTTAS